MRRILAGRFKVIATSLVAAAILLTGLVLMASASATGETFEAHFDDVIGLNNNAQVMHQGVKVGEITSIEPLDGGGREAKLTVTLQDGADLELQTDAEAVLRLKTLLGELFLDLDPGQSGQPLSGPIELAQTHRDTSIDTILYQGAALYDDVAAAEETKFVIDQFKALVESSGDDIRAITRNTRTLTDGLTEREAVATRIISNLDTLTAATDGRAEELGLAIQDVNATLAKVRDLIVRNRGQIQTLLATINNVIDTLDLEKLDALLAKVPSVIDELDRGTLVLRALLQHRIPALGNLILTPANAAESTYNKAEHIAQTNPFMRDLLVRALESYLGS